MCIRDSTHTHTHGTIFKRSALERDREPTFDCNCCVYFQLTDSLIALYLPQQLFLTEGHSVGKEANTFNWENIQTKR